MLKLYNQIDNKLIYSKEEINILLNKVPLNENNIVPGDKNDEVFRQIINGLFQAKGNLYYEFYSENLIKGRFKWSLSLNATEESIKLLKKLNYIFNNKLDYNIYLLDNEKVHICIFTRDIKLIINEIIPYLNNVYGDKYRCLISLMKINYIQDILSNLNNIEKSKDKKIDLVIKFIYLVYNIVDNSQINIDMDSKLKLILNEYNKESYDNYYLNNKDKYINYINNLLNNYPNKFSLNFNWFLGFFLGNGNILVYIRNKKDLAIWLVYMLKINHKLTPDNIMLFTLIKDFLNNYNIKFKVKQIDNKIEGQIIDQISFRNLFKEWLKSEDYWFNRKIDLFYLNKILSLFKLAKYLKYGLLIRIAILKKYKYLKYKNLNRNSLKLELLSIEEIINDLKEILLSININDKLSTKEFIFLLNITLDKEYIKTKLIKNEENNKYYYFKNSNDTTKLLIFTNYYSYLIKNHLLEDNEDLKFIGKYKTLGYVVKLPIQIKPKEKYFFFSKYNDIREIALLNSMLYKYTKLIDWLQKNIFDK